MPRTLAKRVPVLAARPNQLTAAGALRRQAPTGRQMLTDMLDAFLLRAATPIARDVITRDVEVERLDQCAVP